MIRELSYIQSADFQQSACFSSLLRMEIFLKKSAFVQRNCKHSTLLSLAAPCHFGVKVEYKHTGK